MDYLEKRIGLMLLAYAVGLRVGEAIRDKLYREKSTRSTRDCSSYSSTNSGSSGGN